MGHFAASVASQSVAPSHAHIRAINNRRKGLSSEEQKRTVEGNDKAEKVKTSLSLPFISSMSL